MLVPFLCALILPNDITARKCLGKVGKSEQRGQIYKDKLETLQGCTGLAASLTKTTALYLGTLETHHVHNI